MPGDNPERFIEKFTCQVDSWLDPGTLTSYRPRSATKITGRCLVALWPLLPSDPSMRYNWSTNAVVSNSRKVKAEFVYRDAEPTLCCAINISLDASLSSFWLIP